MSLYKRGPNYWVDFAHGGHRIQHSTGTSDKTKAREYYEKLRASLWDEERLGKRPDRSWKEAVVRWNAESRYKASHETDLVHLRYLRQFLEDKRLSEINRVLLDRIVERRLSDGVSNASVNRMQQVIRVILRRAVNEWEWIDRCPKFRMLPEPTRRVRWLKPEEADRLIGELPDHLKAMVIFSLHTGLRKANVIGLQWSQVDLVRRCVWIHADQAKARKSLFVPLTNAAVLVLRQQMDRHQDYAFTYLGKPVYQVNGKAWRRALDRAGIKEFRWHDLRHTWATWHVMNGTPLHVLQELGGWESVEMVRRYAHFSNEHLAGYVERFSGLQLVDGGQRTYDFPTLPTIEKGSIAGTP
jgi:integrase